LHPITIAVAISIATTITLPLPLSLLVSVPKTLLLPLPLLSRLTSAHVALSFHFVKIFDGNKDSNTVVFSLLNPPITGRFIRIQPVEWHNHISMRTEFYGCPGIQNLIRP